MVGLRISTEKLAAVLLLVFCFAMPAAASDAEDGLKGPRDLTKEECAAALKELKPPLTRLALADSQFYIGCIAYRDNSASYSFKPWFRKAVEGYRREAEQGDARAQVRMGDMHRHGYGFPLPNPRKAASWYRKAAEQGNIRAQMQLGRLYRHGKPSVMGYPYLGGFWPNGGKAVHWYRKAAERGVVEAQYALGDMYSRGHRVPRDGAEAAVWYKKAAKNGSGSGRAEHELGDIYHDGTGVPRDGAQAESWYRKSAERGFAQSLIALGDMYREGDIIARDEAEAKHWYRKAVEQESIPEVQAKAQYWLDYMRPEEEAAFFETTEDMHPLKKAAKKTAGFVVWFTAETAIAVLEGLASSR